MVICGYLLEERPCAKQRMSEPVGTHEKPTPNPIRMFMNNHDHQSNARRKKRDIADPELPLLTELIETGVERVVITCPPTGVR